MTSWIDHQSRASYSDEPGQFSDGFGSTNAGPAISIEDVIIEAPTVADLRALLTRLADLLPADEPGTPR